MAVNTYSFFAPTHVLFGPGQLGHLHEQALPGKKALVVISSGKSTRVNSYLDRTLKELDAAGMEHVVFDGVGSNPTKEAVEAGAKVARENGCDFVVALGGGSVLGAGKVMAMLAPQPSEDLWDYAAGTTGKRKPLDKPELPWIAITTTAGTGSEVDSAGVISKLDTHEKIGVGSPSLFASLAIVDPELIAQYLVGHSWLVPLGDPQLGAAKVTFEPSCRNNWHVHHKGGQVLICVAGRGWYQEWDKPAQELRPGDVVSIPPEVKHWHGAARDSWFQHIALAVPAEGASAEWLEPVSDEDYAQLA